MKRTTNKTCRIGMLLFVCSAMALGCLSQRTAACADRKGAEPEVEQSLQAIRMSQSFTYVSGGRDPFVIRNEPQKPEDDLTGDEEEYTTAKLPVENGTESKKEEQLRILNQAKIQVEKLLIERDFEGALAACEKTRGMVEVQWGGDTSLAPQVQAVYREILTYERTGKRLSRMEKIWKEFEALPINIKGLRWSPAGSAVDINDTIYEPGNIIDFGAGSAGIQIEWIDEGGVTFLYKGYRFRKTLSELVETDQKIQ